MTKKNYISFEEGLAGTLDDPNHDPDLGCTKDPKTCENLVICFCDEMKQRAIREKRGFYKRKPKQLEFNFEEGGVNEIK